MDRKTVFQAAFIAALVAFICALTMDFGIRVSESGVSLQPSQPTGPGI